MVKLSAALAIVLLSTTSISHAQTGYPECAFTVSDYDGDGYGYENSNTCLVTENTSSDEPETEGPCIDTDGDGWGWNGVSSCTDIVNLPVMEENVFNELQEINKHFGTTVLFPGFPRSFNAAVIHCAYEPMSASITFYLLYDGTSYYVLGPLGRSDPTVRSGLWSTGLSNKDGRIRMYVGGAYFPMIISKSEIGFEGKTCSWLTP